MFGTVKEVMKKLLMFGLDPPWTDADEIICLYMLYNNRCVHIFKEFINMKTSNEKPLLRTVWAH